jgi:hypothetical protein
VRRLVTFALAAVLLGSCASAGSEAQKPVPTISFPKQVVASSVHQATLEITNPGSKALETIVVAFSDLGRAPNQPGIPEPIVRPGFKGHNRGVKAVTPKPVAVSDDGLVYRFGRLDGGSQMRITFTLQVPADPGVAANAVIVSDGSDLKRSQGVPLSTQVNG